MASSENGGPQRTVPLNHLVDVGDLVKHAPHANSLAMRSGTSATSAGNLPCRPRNGYDPTGRCNACAEQVATCSDGGGWGAPENGRRSQRDPPSDVVRSGLCEYAAAVIWPGPCPCLDGSYCLISTSMHRPRSIPPHRRSAPESRQSFGKPGACGGDTGKIGSSVASLRRYTGLTMGKVVPVGRPQQRNSDRHE